MGPPNADLALCSLHQVARPIPTDGTLQAKKPTTLSWHAWAGRDENPVRAHHASRLANPFGLMLGYPCVGRCFCQFIRVRVWLGVI